MKFTNKRRITALLAVCIMLPCTLFGCGKAKYSEISDSLSEQQNSYDSDYVTKDEAAESSGSSKTPEQSQRKIIKNASIDLETENSAALYQTLFEWVSANGGFEFSKEQYKSGDATVVNATLKIPPEQLNAFIDFASSKGDLINSDISSEDITDSYYDVEIRLQSKRKSLESYYKLLAQCTTIEEITTTQNYINTITEEIEALEGRLNLWTKQIEQSTVRLTIREYRDPIKIKKEIHWNTLTADDMLYLMKSGFIKALNFIVSALQWLVIVFVAVLPVSVVLLIVFIIIRCRRKSKKAVKNKNDEQKQTK